MTKESAAWKHGLDGAAIHLIAANLRRVQPSFRQQAFLRDASHGLERLELKARVMHVVKALRRHLGDDVLDAIDILVRAGEVWEPGARGATANDFAPWPMVEFVGEYGLDHFDGSMEALRRLTAFSSAEFAVRGFIERYPARSMKRIRRWSRDPSAHVRRLASEGTRPRLPWGRRLRMFQEDPTPVLDLLEKLKDDDAKYVRRSVANNLNDIAKDHPERVIAVCARWAEKASPERQWIIRHATRTLVKDGHPGALALLGFDPEAKVGVRSLALVNDKLRLGDDLEFSFELRSTANEQQRLAIDYAIHRVLKSGDRRAKIFKLRVLEIGGRARATVRKRHAFRKISTREYYAGKHTVEIVINGKSCVRKDFHLSL